MGHQTEKNIPLLHSLESSRPLSKGSIGNEAGAPSLLQGAPQQVSS